MEDISAVCVRERVYAPSPSSDPEKGRSKAEGKESGEFVLIRAIDSRIEVEDLIVCLLF